MTNSAILKVWRDLTQPELDAQYDQRTLVPDVGIYMARWSSWSAQVRKEMEYETHAYGPSKSERLDLFRGDRTLPVHLHIHGGAWRTGSKDSSSFVVRGLGASGAPVAVLGIGLAPAVRLPQIVAQVRRAALWLLAQKSLSGRLTLSGHSSGAHLAACLLEPHWQLRAEVEPDAIAGAVLAGGPYDLEPVQLSARNSYLSLSVQEAMELSPVRHMPHAPPRTFVFWGENELEEFRRQGRAMAQVLRADGGELPGQNHFDVYDLFHDPQSAISIAVAGITRA